MEKILLTFQIERPYCYMTERKIRIKIAESLGWKREYIYGNGVDNFVWIDPKGEKAWIDLTDDGIFPPFFPKAAPKNWFPVV